MREPGLRSGPRRILSSLGQAVAHRRVDRLALFGLTGLAVGMGVFLRVRLLGSGSLWMDELWTLDAVSRSFMEMVGARLVSDQSPPLWTMLSWIWLNLLGTYDAASMRILPMAFGCLGIAAPIAGAIQMRALRPTFLVMASLLAISLFTIQYAVEFRAYSMMIGLGAVATVIWAGLLTEELPRSGPWIFTFALTGALAGFGHYYGNLLYGAELLVLLAVFASGRRWRQAIVLLAWGVLSLAPVVAWYLATTHWHQNQAVADPPSLALIQTWLSYAFAPVTDVVAGDLPGYQGAEGYGVLAAGLVALSILTAVIWHALSRNRRTTGLVPAVAGAFAAVVVVIGISVAWLMSLLEPPSMNVRNLAALLPALFLATACACTLLPERVRWSIASIAVAALLVGNGLFVWRYGLASLTPPWQEQAGYRDAAKVLISASHESPRPTFIGLNTAWDWHGQWDAAIRSELGARPVVSSDPEPLAVIWINSLQDVGAGEVPHGPMVVFSDEQDQRTPDLFAWAEKTAGSCRQSTFGGPSYGVVLLLRCG